MNNLLVLAVYATVTDPWMWISKMEIKRKYSFKKQYAFLTNFSKVMSINSIMTCRWRCSRIWHGLAERQTILL